MTTPRNPEALDFNELTLGEAIARIRTQLDYAAGNIRNGRVDSEAAVGKAARLVGKLARLHAAGHYDEAPKEEQERPDGLLTADDFGDKPY